MNKLVRAVRIGIVIASFWLLTACTGDPTDSVLVKQCLEPKCDKSWMVCAACRTNDGKIAHYLPQVIEKGHEFDEKSGRVESRVKVAAPLQSGATKIESDSITIGPLPPPEGSDTAQAAPPTDGYLEITVWFGEEDEEDSVCGSANRFGPYTVTVNQDYTVESISPQSIPFSGTTRRLVAEESFSICIRVEANFDFHVEISHLTFVLDRCAPCDDDNGCTDDFCTVDVDVCLNLKNAECDDGNPCTDDVCAGGACSHDSNADACDDGDPCTAGDQCVNGVCAGILVEECCATDDDCDDGEFCTGTETCDRDNPDANEEGCVGGTAPCAAGEFCDEDIDTCKPPCTTDDDCDDGDPCTGVEICDFASGDCLAGTPVDCDDGEFCTGTETCDPDNPDANEEGCVAGTGPCAAGESCDEEFDTCRPCTTDDDCDDGEFCTGTETCDPDNPDSNEEGCVAGTGPCAAGESCDEDIDTCMPCTTDDDCDDGEACTDDSCANGICQYTNNADACNDGDPCTTNDVCSGGVCFGTLLVCKDGKACTDGSCSNGICQYTNNANACNDGDSCTTNDVCFAGTCSGTLMNCDDNDACTVDSCANGECDHAFAGCDCLDHSDCDDGEFCTGTETCDPDNPYANEEGCVAGTAPCATGESCDEDIDTCTCTIDDDCNDGKACTDDSCSNGFCQYTNNANACNDGDSCTTNDVCSGGVCFGTLMNCDDNDACTVDSCANGECDHVFAGCDCLDHSDCDDGKFCTGTETCDPDHPDANEEGCVAGIAPCAAGESCDEEIDTCIPPCTSDDECNDGDPCNGVEICDFASGDCLGGTPVECPEGETCEDGNCVCGDPCDGMVTTLTLRYNGSTQNAEITIEAKRGPTTDPVYDEVVNPGETFTIVGPQSGTPGFFETLGTEIDIYVNGELNTTIHTSCSQPIGPGLISGDFEVVSGESKNGGPLCPLDQTANSAVTSEAGGNATLGSSANPARALKSLTDNG